MAEKNKLSSLERLKQRKAQIEQQLKALEAKQKTEDRKRDTRRKIIVGAAVLAHAERDAAFAASLRSVLKKAVTEERNLAVIADLLGGVEPGTKPQGQAEPDAA